MNSPSSIASPRQGGGTIEKKIWDEKIINEMI
jgi:hypothetical protein